MKSYRKALFAAMILAMALVLAGCCLSHQWQEATCAAPRTCVKCEKTEGEALPHNWAAATCTAPQTCRDCGAQEGEPAEHTWQEATCLEPQTCSVCSTVQGEPLGHSGVEEEQGVTDCVSAVVTWDTRCQRCEEWLSVREEPMGTLHQDNRFLLTPEEFVKRLNAGDTRVQGEIQTIEGILTIVVTSEGKLLGNIVLANTQETEEHMMVRPEMAQTPSCFDYIVVVASADIDLYAPVMASAVVACDPTLSFGDGYEQLLDVLMSIFDNQQYQRSGIAYTFSQDTANGTCTMTIGFA